MKTFEVTKQQYNILINPIPIMREGKRDFIRLGGVIFHRQDKKTGKYFVKVAYEKYVPFVEQVISKS